MRIRLIGHDRRVKGRAYRAATASVAIVAVVGLGVSPSMAMGSPAHAKPTAADIRKAKAKAVKRTTRAVKSEASTSSTPGLAPAHAALDVKVTSCKQRGTGTSFAGFTCSWAAHGELPGIIPFRCNGKAITDATGAVKSIDPCDNLDEVQAPLLASPHPVSFGYYETFDVYTDLYDELAGSGADIAKEGVTWRSLQKSEGADPASWDWTSTDAIYRQLTAIGVKPVWTLINAPCWAAPAAANCNPAGVHPVAPAHLDDYADAAAQIALRYPDSAAIEVWLEPNDTNFWGAAPDPTTFSHLVGATAAKVAATNTGIPVISGGLSPGRASSAKLEMGKFLKQALSAGGIQSASAIGYHAIADVPYKPGTDSTKGYLGRIRINIQELEDAIAQAGATNPIAVTQLAFSSANGYYSEPEQADALVSSYQLLRRISGISLILVSKLLDDGDGTKVQGFGVLAPNHAPKPAFCQLAAARGVAKPSGC
jgi:hypothetical protein